MTIIERIRALFPRPAHPALPRIEELCPMPLEVNFDGIGALLVDARGDPIGHFMVRPGEPLDAARNRAITACMALNALWRDGDNPNVW